MSDGWTIAETEFRRQTAKAYEGLFTLGSGYLHVRGGRCAATGELRSPPRVKGDRSGHVADLEVVEAVVAGVRAPQAVQPRRTSRRT